MSNRPAKFCKNGHLLAETRRFNPGGGSYCGGCKNKNVKAVRDVCRNGHELAVTRKTFPNGHSCCGACKTQNDRSRYEKQIQIKNYDNYTPPKLIHPSKFQILVEGLKHVLRPEVSLDELCVWIRFYVTEFDNVI